MVQRIRFKNWNEYEKHRKCDKYYVIRYKTQHSFGYYKIKTSLYEDYLKKFSKVLKDCQIVSMEVMNAYE